MTIPKGALIKKMLKGRQKLSLPRRKAIMTADIRVRLPDNMRACLDLYAEECGYKTMSAFCRDLLMIHLQSYARSNGLE